MTVGYLVATAAFHKDRRGHIDFIVVALEGRLYPIVTCLNRNRPDLAHWNNLSVVINVSRPSLGIWVIIGAV
jgi:hypothetical protein